MITILYFGVLKQNLNTARESLAWAGGNGHDLLALLRARGSEWESALAEDRIFRLVVNKKIGTWEDEIPDGAEVGLLPPVTGG
ncbi:MULTISPECIES: MoaD/ThiS family protein [Neisseria]|uniref:Molybdopterin synthase sulfur carrier subunit n=1 Tax=Neisseria dumasiana TaxID=1931275 RepID=A0A1X3DJZ7_9NEIS|nr:MULTISPECIES: MoaD/ThiS family protein [Neisseria]KPN74845.1 molybdopterin converting factor [Neisseria sp. 74A18]OSI24251.1 molybdopterin synthase sulfur carrier subunit [Neisseria dumasiana]OSI36655.1 molybdopterin synthase sulfur carrier subunit [Neisseria dumasiana]UOO85259.1 MoaD/ThiS family protein [Neisseria dumasiana]